MNFSNYSSAITELRSYKDDSFIVESVLLEASTQIMVSTASKKSQTKWVRYANSSTQHIPTQLSDKELEEELKSPSLSAFFEKIYPSLEEALTQNELVDVDKGVISVGEELGNLTKSNLEGEQIFTHLEYTKGRQVLYLEWHPEIAGMIIMCTGPKGGYQDVLASLGVDEPSYGLVWSFEDPVKPRAILQAPEELTKISFCPRLPSAVVATTACGSVHVFDVGFLTGGGPCPLDYNVKDKQMGVSMDSVDSSIISPIISSSISSSHHGYITALSWLPANAQINPDGTLLTSAQPRATSQFVTAGTDGIISVWSLGNTELDVLGRDELVSILKISVVTPVLKNCAINSFLFDHSTPSSTFLASIEDGQVITMSWDGAYETLTKETKKLKRRRARGFGQVVDDSAPKTLLPLQTLISTSVPTIDTVIKAHSTTIHSLQRSQFLPEVTMSADRFCVCLWNRDMPIFKIEVGVENVGICITCACLSDARPGVILFGLSDGSVSVWDLIDSTQRPFSTTSVCVSSITHLCYRRRVKLAGKRGMADVVACGDSQGSVHILEIPRVLRQKIPHEATTMKRLLASEVIRQEYVDARTKELALKSKEVVSIK
ncbi:hypothetical protein ADUPG1_010738 [Aduncisulcus paluster]|uniref:Uncharacterized protein n=1 Tax=Aduncisulcus paluster TaxID=2918883 RepID=A0ABQ5JXU2_9EUKA|nr:hypothetical protein ADUPG1_010738 [Aduncisulcus paluster]